jgi:hypothetical protein
MTYNNVNKEFQKYFSGQRVNFTSVFKTPKFIPTCKKIIPQNGEVFTLSKVQLDWSTQTLIHSSWA